jgi:hypothetical protein
LPNGWHFAVNDQIKVSAGEKSQAVLVVFVKNGGKDTELWIESIFWGFI